MSLDAAQQGRGRHPAAGGGEGVSQGAPQARQPKTHAATEPVLVNAEGCSSPAQWEPELGPLRRLPRCPHQLLPTRQQHLRKHPRQNRITSRRPLRQRLVQDAGGEGVWCEGGGRFDAACVRAGWDLEIHPEKLQPVVRDVVSHVSKTGTELSGVVMHLLLAHDCRVDCLGTA